MHEAINNFRSVLACPVSGGNLSIEGDYLVSDSGCKYEVFENVINFTGDLSTNYDKHWEKFESSPLKVNRSENFFKWSTQRINEDSSSINVLDLGCGDGNHTPLFNNFKYIAVDISKTIYDLASKHRESNNMIFLKADAFSLPIKNQSVDFIFSFAGVNYFPSYGEQSLNTLLGSLDKILSSKGYAALWGAGSKSKLSVFAFELYRKIYKKSPNSLKDIILFIGCLSASIIKNSSNMNIFNSPIAHVKEIVSTNLTPDYINYFENNSWVDLAPKDWLLIEEYDYYCGQLFQKP